MDFLLFAAFIAAAAASYAPYGSEGSGSYHVIPMEVLGGRGSDGCAPPEISDAERAFLSEIRWFGLLSRSGCPLHRKAQILSELGASGALVKHFNLPLQRPATSPDPAPKDSGPKKEDSTEHFVIIPITSFFYRHLLKTFYLKGGVPLRDIAAAPRGRPLPFPEINVKGGGRTILDAPAVQVGYIAFLIVMIFFFPLIFHKLDEYDGADVKVVKPSVLFGIPTCCVKNLEGKIKFEDCPICLDAFAEEALVRPLDCGHYFHIECIDPWLLNRSNRCPICKTEIPES